MCSWVAPTRKGTLDHTTYSRRQHRQTFMTTDVSWRDAHGRIVRATRRQRGASERAPDEHTAGEVRSGIGRRENVVGRLVPVRTDGRSGNRDSTESVARAQITERAPVRRRVARTDFELRAARELDAHHMVVRRGRTDDFCDRHDDHSSMVDAKDRISDAKASDGAVTARRRYGRVRGSANTRGTSPRTGSAGVLRIDTADAGPRGWRASSRGLATDLVRRAASVATANRGWSTDAGFRRQSAGRHDAPRARAKRCGRRETGG